MVAAMRRGVSMRQVAKKFRVALSTVQYWVQRAWKHRLDRVEWSDRPRGPRIPANKSARALEDLVLTLRRQLKESSDLGEFGAHAIYRELQDRGVTPLPSVRTLGRILARRGALDDRQRLRRPAPPRGWYLPDVAAGHAELDSFDIIEGLVIKGGTDVEVLTGISLHGGLVASWPRTAITADIVVEALLQHWQAVGLPAYAQFDNDTRFQGPHQHPDTLGRVTRVCLSLGVVPVFVPPRESGFQAAIENFNGRWQAKVWARFQHKSLPALQAQSAKYIAASLRRYAPRIESAPARRLFPKGWRLDLKARPQGRILFLRRTSDQGAASLLGHTFALNPHWPHRLVRAEVDLDANVIRFYALRRREPTRQPLLREVHYELPHRRFNP
jgi:hypothetical protein